MATEVPEKLPPFSPPGTVSCRMCGSTGIEMEYRACGYCLHNTGNGDDTISTDHGKANPRMHRRCVRCGHMWDERTLADSHGVRDKMWTRMGAPLPAEGP